MKKLNNKGFTVVELTLSFLFVFTLAFSMYELLFNYRTKQNEEAIKAELVDYSNQVVLAIQNDINEKILKNIEYCTAGGEVVDKCLLLNFNDSTTKQLSVEKRDYEYDGEIYQISYINYGGIYYESPDAMLLDFRPNYMLYTTQEKDNLEDPNVKVYKISIPIYHNDLDDDYGVEVVAVGYNYDEPDIKYGSIDEINPDGPTNIAIYSETDKSLTFVNISSSLKVGDTYSGKVVSKMYIGFEEEEYSSTTVPWNAISEKIKSVNVATAIKPISTANWFYGFVNCSNFNVSNINVSNTTNMANMFHSAGANVTESFTITGLNNWNTSNVTDMHNMFYHSGQNASSFNIGNLSNWNTGKVTSMTSMFNRAGEYATTFNIGNLDNWNVSNVKKVNYMFYHAGNIATTWNIGKLTNWDVSKVTNMFDFFAAAGTKATTWNIGDLSGWNTSQVKDMGYMFYKTGYQASSYNLGDLSNWNVSNVTNMNQMFCKAGYNSTTFKLSSSTKLNWNTSKVTNMDQMFNDAGKSATYTLDLSTWNVNAVDKTLHTYFNNSVETKITPPTWVN